MHSGNLHCSPDPVEAWHGDRTCLVLLSRLCPNSSSCARLGSIGTIVCTCAKVPTSHSCWSLHKPPKSDSALLLPEALLLVPSGLLLEASVLLEDEEDSDARSASADGTAEDVMEEALSDVWEDSEADAEFADSEAADSADDMPSVSSEGCHMKAPTYACALPADKTGLIQERRAHVRKHENGSCAWWYKLFSRHKPGGRYTWQCVKHLTACNDAIGKRHISMNSKRKCPYLRVIGMTEFTQPLPAAFQIQDLVNELGVIHSHRLQAAREQRPSLQRHRKHLKSGQSCRKQTVLLVSCFTERGLQSHSSALAHTSRCRCSGEEGTSAPAAGSFFIDSTP